MLSASIPRAPCVEKRKSRRHLENPPVTGGKREGWPLLKPLQIRATGGFGTIGRVFATSCICAHALKRVYVKSYVITLPILPYPPVKQLNSLTLKRFLNRLKFGLSSRSLPFILPCQSTALSQSKPGPHQAGDWTGRHEAGARRTPPFRDRIRRREGHAGLRLAGPGQSDGFPKALRAGLKWPARVFRAGREDQSGIVFSELGRP